MTASDDSNFNSLPKSNEVFDASGNHIQFGDNDTFSNPPGFNGPSNDAGFNPQPFGRGIDDDDDDDMNAAAQGR